MSHSYFSLIAPACMMLLSLVFFASYRLVSRRPYLKLIGLAYLFSAAPMAIQSLSDNSGLASNSSLSAIFYLWGIWLFAKGFTLRSQVETWPKIAFIFGATTVGLLTYFSLVDDQLWLRTVIINLGLASISLLGIKGCFSQSRRDDLLHTWISLAYIALILLEFARAFIGFKVIAADLITPMSQPVYWQILLASSMLISLVFACLLIASLFHDLMLNMKNDSEIDALTSLLNRRGFHTRANHLLSQQRTRAIFVLMGDIDHFKSFNDTYGHAMGDTILEKSRKRLNSNCAMRM